jgi:hypothetical protein
MLGRVDILMCDDAVAPSPPTSHSTARWPYEAGATPSLCMWLARRGREAFLGQWVGSENDGIFLSKLLVLVRSGRGDRSDDRKKQATWPARFLDLGIS